jgi:hypothetical protein
MVVNGGFGWNVSLAKGALVRAGAYCAVKVREPLNFEFSLITARHPSQV